MASWFLKVSELYSSNNRGQTSSYGAVRGGRCSAAWWKTSAVIKQNARGWIFRRSKKKVRWFWVFFLFWTIFFATVYCLLAVSRPMNSPSLSCVSCLPWLGHRQPRSFGVIKFLCHPAEFKAATTMLTFWLHWGNGHWWNWMGEVWIWWC